MNSPAPTPSRRPRLAGRVVRARGVGIVLALLQLLLGPRSIAGAETRSSPSPGWVESIGESLRRSEYEFTAARDGGWSAPNRVNGLRTHVDGNGAAVVDRVRGADGFDLRLSLAGVGRGSALTPVDAGVARGGAERVEIRRGALTEWFVNGPAGLEHGITLASAPEPGDAASPAVLSIRLDGSLLAYPEGNDGRSILFRDARGEAVLRYAELHVTDARGAELPARMTLGFGVLRIEIDDRDALYPVTVDPLLTLAVWTAEPNQDAATFGVSVSTAGDVNGDGYSDVIVGAELYDNGEVDEGRAFLYAGSPSGPGASPVWTAEGNEAGASFARSVATAGDVNGDGYADVIVGAWFADNGQIDEGRAYVYLGSPSGLSVAPSWTGESNQAAARYGYSVSSAGDVNGDGYSDVVVGAWFYDNGQADEGRAYVYHGGPGGLALSPAWTAESDQASAGFGSAVGNAGDVNGDGYSDVIVAARAFDNGQTDEGKAYVFFGSASGLAAAPGWTAESNQANALFGVSVDGAGDVNGDGYADVIVGSHFYDAGQTNEGRAFVYHGSPSGPSLAADWTAEPNQATANFGISVGCAGDVNGDGYADVIIGSWFEDNGQSDEGRAYLYQGSATGLAAVPSWTGESDQLSAQYGAAVAGAGDVNGDGFSDVIVGAPSFDNVEADEGRAYVYLGTASGLSINAPWRGESDQASAAFGTSVASAGDVNGDGFSDVIVGAPTFDNGETDEGRAFVYLGSAAGLPLLPSWTAEPDVADARFGGSVASAGDVNGDGYSDVVVGAPRFTNGQAQEGRAYVYSGSAAGLSAAPSWTYESNRAGALAGSSASRAGDVNGDGYADVVVGAPAWSNPQAAEGAALVFLGGPAGLAAAPVWTVESNQTGARMGTSVTSAGDLNQDGFSDLAVGAPLYDGPDLDEGRVFLYAGSASGPSVSPTFTLEVNQAGAEFGTAVAAGGDVNSDGYADLLAGAPRFDNGSNDEGEALLYPGGPGGVTGIVAWKVEANQAGANLGFSVASAGDVNNDGYGDVIVGTINYDNVHIDEGRALVYLGSASGLALNAAWAEEANQNGAQLGSSVACAGDVNGDGFSDIVFGAPSYDNGSADEGIAEIHYGNDHGGAARVPRQARASGAAPIAILGVSDSASEFRVRQLGRLPAGRGRVRLEVEVKPRGTPLDGTGTVLSTAQVVTPAGGAAFSFDESIAGLSASTAYAWRARIRSTDPLFYASPWFGMPDNAIRLVDLRTLCASAVTYYRDADGDGWGSLVDTVAACALPAGYTTQTGDCDDTRSSIFPGGTEVCNARDDDCDTQVDEGLGTISCGLGACVRTAEACVNGGPGPCVPGTPAEETCNLVDDDCDGSVDDDLGYVSCGVGACLDVVVACYEGQPIPCVPHPPSDETCNNIDDDCDGLVDDLGQTTCGIGPCQRTVDNCAGGVPHSCVPGTPGTESCNLADDDCDGSVDEDLGYVSCGTGACLEVVVACFEGQPIPCTPHEPTQETCNNIDDDCDGTVDDVSQTTCGVGACRRTVQDCVAGQSNSCVPGSPSQETCNGADDDCDGTVDEELGYTSCGVGACLLVVDFCYAGAEQPCTPFDPSPETCNGIDDDCDNQLDELGQTTCGVGACQVTVNNCENATPQTCVPNAPSPESCNGIDDNCDGLVDNMGQTSCGVGRCQNTVDNCTNGIAHVCIAFDPIDEACNGLDDDCDGTTDEDFGQSTCGTGPCQRTVDNCVDGHPQACVPLAPSTEDCNGIDDDCNGVIDDVSSSVSGVRFQADRTSLTWSSNAGAVSFDVVKGDLGVLKATAGSFTTSLLACLADGFPAPPVADTERPEAGHPFYYLVRSTNCQAVTGTYDGGSPHQVASRDPGIAASPAACP